MIPTLLAFVLAVTSPIAHQAASVATPMSPYTCRSLAGDAVDLSSSRGTILVMTFVNTECSHCLRTALRVSAVFRQLASRDRTAFILIAVNDDAHAKLPRFTEDASLPFPACIDTKAHAEQFLGIPATGALLTPTVVFLDEKGTVRDAMPPGDKRLADPTTIREALDRVLSAAQSGPSVSRE